MRTVTLSKRRSLQLICASLLGLIVSPVQAQWTGAVTGTTNDSTHSFLTTGNWTGGIVLDTFAPTLTGTTTLYFGGDRTTTGTFNLNYAGAFNLTLQGGGLVDAAGAPTAAANHTITLGGDVNADYTGGAQTVTIGSATANNALNLDLNGTTRTFTIATSDNLTLTNGLLGTGGGALTKAGAGALTLNGPGTYTGLTTISAGTIVIGHNTALGTSAAGTTVSSLTGVLTLTNNITVTGEALSINGDGAAATTGQFRNSSGNNTWTGAITVGNNATTRVHSAGGLMTLSGPISIATGGTQFVLQGDGNGLISGDITGAANLTKGTNGTGKWTLSGTNTYTGNTTVSSGTLQFAKRLSLYNGVTGDWTSAKILTGASGTMAYNLGGTGEFTDADIAIITGNGGGLTAGGRFALDISNVGSGNYTYGNIIQNSGAVARNFVKIGTGNLTLSAGNTYTGTTAVEGGTLTLSGANSYAGSTIVGTTALPGILNIQNNSALGTAAAGTTVTNAASQLQIQGGLGGLTITGEALALAASASNGSGAVLNVSGTNLWTGNVTADTSAGILRIFSDAGKLTFSGTVTTSSASQQFVIAQGNGDLEYTNVISGPAAITRSSAGTGTLTISGLNTYTGATNLSGGKTLVGIDAPNNAAGAFGVQTSAVNINSAGTIEPILLTNGAFTIGRDLSVAAGTLPPTIGGNAAAVSNYTGAVSLGRSVILSQVANGTVNFSGAMTGTGTGVTVDGLGIVNLDGSAKAFTGTITVNSLAKLLVNTSVASPTVTVNGTIGGGGTLSGAVNLGATGILAPGNSVGTLNTGALSLNNLSTLSYELGLPNIVGGGTNDLTTVTGNLTLDGVVNVTALTGFGVGSYRLFDYTGSLTNNTLDVGTIPAGYTASVDTSVANQVNLVVAAVPEPSTFVVGAVGVLGFAILRRRRTR